MLRDNPLTGALCQGVESDQQQRQRVEVLGNVTMFGRRDLAQHFVISCGLTALLGPRTAEAVGIFKEVTDSQRNSGFSFADLLADMSGVVFSQDVLSGDIQLDELAKSFRVVDYMPDPAGEEEGIPWREFVSSYGSAQDERFHRRKDAIRDRILSLPKYQ